MVMIIIITIMTMIMIMIIIIEDTVKKKGTFVIWITFNSYDISKNEASS